MTYERDLSLQGLGNFSRCVMLVVLNGTVWCHGADVLVNYVCSFLQQSNFCSRAMILFLRRGEYFCLAICLVIKLFNLYVLAELISVRL